jgi:hypothetical protein
MRTLSREDVKLARQKRRTGDYARDGAASRLDGRSKEALFLRRFKADLYEQLGGEQPAGVRALVERAAWLALRCSQFDEKIVAGTLTEHDSKQLLSWTGHLSRLLKTLGVIQPSAKAAPTGPSLEEFTAALNAREAAQP